MSTWRLRLDPITCDGRGICAELLPELVDLDDWGYPVLARGAVPAELLVTARRAAAACPTLALRLERLKGAAPAGDAPRPRAPTR